MSVTVRAPDVAGAEAVMSDEDMYRLGLEASVASNDTEFDLVTAHKWFNLAAMQGNVEARSYRAELALEMTAEEIAEAQRQARAYLATHRPRRHG